MTMSQRNSSGRNGSHSKVDDRLVSYELRDRPGEDVPGDLFARPQFIVEMEATNDDY